MGKKVIEVEGKVMKGMKTGYCLHPTSNNC